MDTNILPASRPASVSCVCVCGYCFPVVNISQAHTFKKNTMMAWPCTMLRKFELTFTKVSVYSSFSLFFASFQLRLYQWTNASDWIMHRLNISGKSATTKGIRAARCQTDVQICGTRTFSCRSNVEGN